MDLQRPVPIPPPPKRFRRPTHLQQRHGLWQRAADGACQADKGVHVGAHEAQLNVGRVGHHAAAPVVCGAGGTGRACVWRGRSRMQDEPGRTGMKAYVHACMSASAGGQSIQKDGEQSRCMAPPPKALPGLAWKRMRAPCVGWMMPAGAAWVPCTASPSASIACTGSEGPAGNRLGQVTSIPL